jgi:hypothetical protein
MSFPNTLFSKDLKGLYSLKLSFQTSTIPSHERLAPTKDPVKKRTIEHVKAAWALN